MIASALPTAGLETVIAYLVKGLSGRGHDVGVTCLEERGQLGERLQSEGFRITVVPTPGLRTNIRPTRLLQWFGNLRPDVVHVHSGAWLKGVAAAKWAGIERRIYTLHGIHPVRPLHTRIISRLAATLTTRAVAVSDSLARHLQEEVRMPARRIRVIGNGIDTSRFAPGTRDPGLARRIGIPEGAFVVGTVARLHPVKNHALLIDAFAGFQKSRPFSILVIVGEGELRAELEARAAELGIADRVLMPGVIPDTAPVYRLFDVFALSSHIEGTSMSALEAMATQVPVVATAVGGNPQLLDDGSAGSLVAPGDVGAFRDELVRLATDQGYRTAFAEAGRRRVMESYSHESMLDAYEAIYAERDPRG